MISSKKVVATRMMRFMSSMIAERPTDQVDGAACFLF